MKMEPTMQMSWQRGEEIETYKYSFPSLDTTDKIIILYRPNYAVTINGVQA